ncbi:MAG: hypothetical protein Kilf2KO_31090 [Rhodospirillales bacterium]
MLIICSGFQKTPSSFIYQVIFQMLEEAGFEQFDLRNEILATTKTITKSAHLALSPRNLASLLRALPTDRHMVVKTHDPVAPFLEDPEIAGRIGLVALDRGLDHAAASLVRQSIYLHDNARFLGGEEVGLVSFRDALKKVTKGRERLAETYAHPAALVIHFEEIFTDIAALIGRISAHIGVVAKPELVERYRAFIAKVLEGEGDSNLELVALSQPRGALPAPAAPAESPKVEA